jgi:D-serine deaminase-like pyridoxal phosphate-dependent protein
VLGITVAKVSEAEVMAESGIRDIFLAYPLVTESKIRRAMRLRACANRRVGYVSRGSQKAVQSL